MHVAAQQPLAHVARARLQVPVDSAAPCQNLRAIAIEWLVEPVGNVGPQVLNQMRGILADLLDL